MGQRGRTLLTVAAGLAVVVLVAGSLYYRFFSDMARCWQLQDNGYPIGCGSRVPD